VCGVRCTLQIAGDPDSDEPMMPKHEGWHRGFVAARARSEVGNANLMMFRFMFLRLSNCRSSCLAYEYPCFQCVRDLVSDADPLPPRK
jgi:hypothetical protein